MENIPENGQIDLKKCNCNNCNCKTKAPLIISIVAVLIAIYSVMKKQEIQVAPVANNSNDIKTVVMDIIKNEPQILLDAMSAGIVKKRDDSIKQLAGDIEKNKVEIINQAFRFGPARPKNSVLCFIDPTCEQCRELQRNMINILKAKKDVCFYLIPVSILGENSQMAAALYCQIREIDNNQKLTDFIAELVKENATAETAMTAIDIDKSALNQFADKAKKQLVANNALFEKLKIKSTPAVFLSKNNGPFEVLIDPTTLTAAINSLEQNEASR